MLIKFVADVKLRETEHTFRDRSRYQDGFHKLKKYSEKYMVLFSKCEVLMTGRNEQLHNKKIRTADQFRNYSRGHRELRGEH